MFGFTKSAVRRFPLLLIETLMKLMAWCVSLASRGLTIWLLLMALSPLIKMIMITM